MCGGGGDDSASREMIQMQKDEQARAAAKEAQRQANIKAGLLNIKYLFEGGKPITKNVAGKFDWSKFKAPTDTKLSGTAVSGLPAGYKYVYTPGVAQPVGVAPKAGTPAAAATPAKAIKDMTPAERMGMLTGANTGQPSWTTNPVQGVPRGGGNQGSPKGGGNTQNSNPSYNNGGIPRPAAAAGPGTWGVVGPDGKVYNIGDNIGTNTVVTTGKTKGWADEFLKKYKQDMINYYQPQVVEQYGKAKDETKYRHAMAGTLSSTANIGNIADLSKQNKINTGEVTSKALEATNKLGDAIDDARAGAEAQVYSTESPTVASTAASRAIKSITAEKPTLTPLGEIFNIATIGAANYLKGSTNASNRAAYGLNPVGRNQKTV